MDVELVCRRRISLYGFRVRYVIGPVATVGNINFPATTTTYPVGPIVKDAVGVYRLDLALSSIGTWTLNIAAQGNPGAVGVGNQSLTIRVFGQGI